MRKTIYIIMCMCMLAACTSGKKEVRKEVTAKVQSAPYELLVVADKGWLKTEAGQSLVNTVEAPIEGLPQVEPNFRTTYINPYAFSGTFKTYANIVVAEVAKKYGKVNMVVEKNVYARPQVVVRLYAPNNKAFLEYVQAHQGDILYQLNQNEVEREFAYLQKHYNGKVMTQAKKQFGVSIRVPADIDDMKVGEGFMWASASKQEFRLNISLYTVPMQELTIERFVELRDSVMKINIPGGREGQWMETDSRTVSGGMERGEEVVKAVFRGLWDMKNDAMGGPFVCCVYPDEKENRLVFVEGFVFAPEEKKRPLIRQLEASLQRVEFLKEE